MRFTEIAVVNRNYRTDVIYNFIRHNIMNRWNCKFIILLTVILSGDG